MKHRFSLLLLAIGLSFCALTTAAQAQATRTWVSGLGDDANPCSRTAPCKTFAGAEGKTADCGEIDALDPGGFGTLTFIKSLKVDGGGGEAGQVASVLAAPAGAVGFTINYTPGTCGAFVVIRNVDIDGVNQGNIGVNFIAGGQVSLENVDIENLLGQCVNAQPSGAMSLVMYNTNLERCAAGGIAISSGVAIRANIEKSTIQRGGSGGPGVLAGNNSFVNIHNSMISNNLNGGLVASGATAKLSIDLSTIANNQSNGVHATNSSTITLANSSVVLNAAAGILADPGTNLLTGNNNWLSGNTPDGSRTGLMTIQ